MSKTNATDTHRWGGRRAIPITITAAVSLALAMGAPSGSPAFADPRHGQGHWIAPASDVLTPRDMAAYKAKKLKDPGPLGTEKVTVQAGNPTDPIDQRILVIATNGDPNPDGIHLLPSGSWDWTLSTLTNALDYVGMPYDTYKSSTKQMCHNGSWMNLWDQDPPVTSCTSGDIRSWGSLGSDRLWDGASHAYYSGVMLTSSDLPGMEWEDWVDLWTFEGAFDIRMVSAYTYPSRDFGMSYVSEGGIDVIGTYTEAGKLALPYVANTVPITGYGYYAGLDSSAGVTADPILTSPGGVLGVIASYPDQNDRQTLALTFDSARYLTHGQVLGFGLVNWVTKGQFLGFRKATLDPQIDDIFVEDDMWWVRASQSLPTNCSAWYDENGLLVVSPSPEDPMMDEYRISGSDLQKVISWQTATQSATISKAFALSMPFNGEGTETGYWTGETTPTLVSVARSNQSRFKWINHSYDHPNLDTITYADAAATISRNNRVAKTLKFTTYNKANFVQPDISGLQNAAFLSAAYDQGVRNLVSDTSRTGNPGLNGPNEGGYNTRDPRLFEVPRYPTNMYFNVTTPEQWLALDQCIYPSGAYGHVEDYDGLVAREATTIIRYLLQGDNRPLMFHEANLRFYQSGRSVFTDVMDEVFAQYSALVTVPITSPTMDSSAALMRARMTYNDALRNGNLSATVVPGKSLTLSSSKTVTVPLTGFVVTSKGVTKESYAGQSITYVKVTAGVPRTVLIR